MLIYYIKYLFAYIPFCYVNVKNYVITITLNHMQYFLFFLRR